MKQTQTMEILNADMVRIEGGAVALRDNRVQRQWQVELKPFCLSKFQVTQALYASVVGKNPSSVSGDQHPVENVSWYDAIARNSHRIDLSALFATFSL